MNNTFFTPDDNRDQKRKQYLDKINHAPYPTILVMVLGLLIIFTGLVLVGSF
jgi:hypothetical protein